MKAATVAICEACWIIEEGEREPVRLTAENRETEHCYRCKQETRSGIYVRRMIPTEKGN